MINLKSNLNKNTRGQVTIFIIIAVLIIAVISLFLYFRTDVIKPSETSGTPEANIEGGMKICMNKKIMEGAALIGDRGGYFASPLNKTFKFTDETKYSSFPYLCYIQNYYETCTIQYGSLLRDVNDNLKKYLERDIRNCMDETVNSLESKGYTVDVKDEGFTLEVIPENIKINMLTKIKLTYQGQTKNYENFNFKVKSALWDNVALANRIINSESIYCYFDSAGLSLLYPKFEIKKVVSSDSSTLYRITNLETGEKFRFAVRGCVSMPGI